MTGTPHVADAFPLLWPTGWPRTPRHKVARAAFRVTSFTRVRDSVLRNVELMGGRSVVLSTNVELRRDGLPYARAPEPRDPGVAVYWYDAGRKQRRAIACDRWDRCVHNLRAIELTLDALRALPRWGSSEIVERAFSGFAALPPAPYDWRSVLGFTGGDRLTPEIVRRAYRERAILAHPDRGGDATEMQRLNAAIEAALAELGRG